MFENVGACLRDVTFVPVWKSSDPLIKPWGFWGIFPFQLYFLSCSSLNKAERNRQFHREEPHEDSALKQLQHLTHTVFVLFSPSHRIQRRQKLYEPMTAKRFRGLKVFIQALTPLHLAVLLNARLPSESLKEEFTQQHTLQCCWSSSIKLELCGQSF